MIGDSTSILGVTISSPYTNSIAYSANTPPPIQSLFRPGLSGSLPRLRHPKLHPLCLNITDFQLLCYPPMKVGNLLSSERFRCVDNQCALLRVNSLDPLSLSAQTRTTRQPRSCGWCIVERLLLYRSHLSIHLLGNSPIARVRAVGTLCLPREISSLEDPHATSRASVWNGIASPTCFLSLLLLRLHQALIRGFTISQSFLWSKHTSYLAIILSKNGHRFLDPLRVLTTMFNPTHQRTLPPHRNVPRLNKVRRNSVHVFRPPYRKM